MERNGERGFCGGERGGIKITQKISQEGGEDETAIMIPSEYKSIYPELIFNQNKSDLCVPCSISLIRHIQIFNRYGINVIPDPIFIYCKRNNDMHQGNGMIVSEALSIVKQYGIPEITDNPIKYLNTYSEYEYLQLKDLYTNKSEILDRDKIKDYCLLYTYNDIKEAIMKYCAVTITVKKHTAIYHPDVNTNEAFINYYKYENYPTENHHQLTIIGWKNDNWIIQNSFGKNYGKNGIAYMPMDVPIIDPWCIIDE